MAPILLGLGSAPNPTTSYFYTGANDDTAMVLGGVRYNDYLDILTASTSIPVTFRFPSITVPKDSTVTNATVSWVARWYDSSPPASYTNDTYDWLDYMVERTDNAAQATTASAITSRMSSFSADVRAYKSSFNGGNGVRSGEADITTAVQEIVNRSGWASGNAIMVFSRSNSGTINGMSAIPHSVASGDSQRPRLTITYY